MTLYLKGGFIWLGGLKDLLTGFFHIIHSFVEGMGVSSVGFAYVLDIVIYTLILKTIVLPLYIYQQKSTMAMSKVQPLMKELQEKYKNNPQKLQEEQMKLYKEMGTNPFKGCLPLIVQMPIFFAMFSVISAMDFSNGSFLWLHNLGAKDPFFILPVLTAVVQFLSMRVASRNMEESQRSMQNKMGLAMGVMFLFICINYKAALAIYFIASSAIQTVQTLMVSSYIKKKQAKEDEIKKVEEEERLKREAAEKAAKREEYKKNKKKKAIESGTEGATSKKNPDGSGVDLDKPRKKKKKRTDESLKPKSESKDGKVVE